MTGGVPSDRIRWAAPPLAAIALVVTLYVIGEARAGGAGDRDSALPPVDGPVGAVAPGPQAALDFEFYRENVEPIFLRDRGGFGPGSAACVTCHVQSGTPLRLQALEEDGEGGVYWTEAQSRLNFQAAARLVTPGQPERSVLLREPLDDDAGGSAFHVGGKFWDSQDDPEWRILAEWVRRAESDRGVDGGASAVSAMDAPVPDFDFFRTCVQRIFLDREEEEDRMECAACHESGSRGFAQSLPDGRDFWNEEESRENFGVVLRYIDPGNPLGSRFLTHPLDPHDGGDNYHSGGRRWHSRDDPEWRMLAAWVEGEVPPCVVEDR